MKIAAALKAQEGKTFPVTLTLIDGDDPLTLSWFPCGRGGR
jgi:hypothetical protein